MEKHVFLLFMFIILTAAFVDAQEAKRVSLGIGIEGNLNSLQNMAVGQSLAVDYGITRFLSAGIKWGFSQNFYQVQAFEPEAFIRFYAGSFLFFQADMGASITLKDYQPYLFILGGITAGVRVPVDHWYVEPYIRGGYPFMAGAGVSAGYRF